MKPPTLTARSGSIDSETSNLETRFDAGIIAWAYSIAAEGG